MANKMTAPLMLYYEQHDLEFGRNCDIDEESKELLSQLLSKVQKSNLLIKTMSVGNSGYLFRGERLKIMQSCGKAVIMKRKRLLLSLGKVGFQKKFIGMK